MTTRREKTLWLFFIVCFTAFYYLWLSIWADSPFILTLGGNLFSLAGAIIASIWLFNAAKNDSSADHIYWLLLAFAASSYVLAEMVWFISETLYGLEVPFPGWPDLFYIAHFAFYFIAFAYKLFMAKNKLVLLSVIFDVLLVMLFFSTLSYYFIISPILIEGDVSLLSLAISLSYPIGDLSLLLVVVTLSFIGQKIFTLRVLLLLLTALLIQIFADTAFSYLVTINEYTSGSWTDPLFILSILLIAYTSFLRPPNKALDNTMILKKRDPFIRRLNQVLTYSFVAILYVLMLSTIQGRNVFSLSIGLAILIIIFKHFFIVRENQNLLSNYLRNSQELSLNEQRYKSLFENHPDAAFAMDLKGLVMSTNRAGSELFGIPTDELVGHSIIEFIHKDFLDNIVEHLEKAQSGEFSHYEFPFSNKKNEFYYLSITQIPIIIDEETVGVYGICRDITENKINEEKIQFLAYHDSLTKLANRVYFEEILNQTIRKAKIEGTSFALLFLDIDNFKAINDEYGHAFGDKLLAQTARRIKEVIDEDGYTARLGGDEFTILLDNITNHKEALIYMNKLIETLHHPYIINNTEVDSLPSIGIAHYPEDGVTSKELLKRADDEMYLNKRTAKKYNLK